MRTLKFRGWDQENKIMLHRVDLSQSGEYWGWLGKRNVRLMQYTGLQDKNGVEIYEGDICQYFKNELLIVVWDESDAKFILIKKSNYKHEYKIDCDAEVIGNIYQNPELIQKENCV